MLPYGLEKLSPSEVTYTWRHRISKSTSWHLLYHFGSWRKWRYRAFIWILFSVQIIFPENM